MKRSAEEAQLQNGVDSQLGQGELPWSQVLGRRHGGNQGRQRDRQRDTQQDRQQDRQQARPQGRKPRPVQYGTAKVSVTGAETRPYDVAIGNTNPGSTEEIIKGVLMEIAENMPEENKLEEPLQILEVECLTKPRTDGSRIWTRTWRVQVPNKFK